LVRGLWFGSWPLLRVLSYVLVSACK
jgi:hypothetical protein